MDKLTIQTVYVPVDYATPFTMAEAGLLGREWMSPMEERIVLTPKELRDLLQEAAFQPNSISPTEFLKSKGIEL